MSVEHRRQKITKERKEQKTRNNQQQNASRSVSLNGKCMFALWNQLANNSCLHRQPFCMHLILKFPFVCVQLSEAFLFDWQTWYVYVCEYVYVFEKKTQITRTTRKYLPPAATSSPFAQRHRVSFSPGAWRLFALLSCRMLQCECELLSLTANVNIHSHHLSFSLFAIRDDLHILAAGRSLRSRGLVQFSC